MPETPDGSTGANGNGDELIARGGKVDRQTLYSLYERQTADDETPISVSFKLSRQLNKRLDRYLVDRIPFLSRTSLQRLIREQAVTVNGRVGKPSMKLHAGDEIVAILPPPPSTEIPAEQMPLEVLHEDDDLIVINKHDDIIVHPARGNRSGTIINGLVWHFQHLTGGVLSTVGEKFARPGVIHRLDRHTTGALVFAKSDVAHWRLARQFEERRVEKRYLAVVHGRVEPLADVIDLPLGRHHTAKEKYAVRWDDTGKPSVTVYRVRELYERFTLLELELKTGRTHQIRVHLSYVGCPVVGDIVYGGEPIGRADLDNPPIPAGSRRDLNFARTRDEGLKVEAQAAERDDVIIAQPALHAAMLQLTHPLTRQTVRYTAPVHEPVATLVRELRKHNVDGPVATGGYWVDLSLTIPP